MGANCTGCVQNNPRHREHNDYSTQPEDTWEYDPTKQKNLPDIKFQGMLSNIKIYNCPQESISLKFIIQDILEALLPRKIKNNENSQIKWKTRQCFQFILNEYQLRKKFLYIQSTDERGKVISSMKINLYYIATGPYHHDFRFKIGKTEPRLQFDLKMSQFVQTKISFEKVQMYLNKKYFEADSLYFNVRLLRAQVESSFESSPSYTETLSQQPSPRQIFGMDADQCQSPIRFKAKKLLAQQNAKVIWTNEKEQLPDFKIYMKSYDIKDSLLHFVVWKIERNQAATLFSDLYLPVYRLYSQESQQQDDKKKYSSSQKQRRNIYINDDTFSNTGQKIGEVKLNMLVENKKYMKQMKACARTEKGVISMVPLVNNYGVNFHQKKDRLSSLRQIVNCIQKMNMQLNHCIEQHQRYEIQKKILISFQNLRQKLQYSLEQSFAMPKTQQQNIKNIEDQIFLLQIVQKIEVFLEDVEVERDVCWHIILAIIKRGQFSLPNIGFKKSQIQQIQKQKKSPQIKKKINVGLQFQKILYRLFLLSLKLGYTEGRDKPKPAIQIFKAYCYFRIPAFRDILLKMVVRKGDETVQWRTDNYETDLEITKQVQNTLVFQLDWELSFYKPLMNEQRSQTLNKQLIDSLQGNIWLSQVAKRGSTFFYFLHFLVKRLLELGKKIKFIKWQYFPGYNKLVKSFLFEMKKLRVSCYPKSLLQTSINLLSNQKLINIFITTVFEKTNIYDCNQLMKGLDIINRYIKFLTKQKKLLPPTFNYVYFFKGLKTILQGQFSYAIMKTIGILFNNYQNFNVEFRKTLSFYLLGKIFFKLFLNWSFSVRSFFYHILILKLSRSTDVFNPESRKQFSNRHELMNEITTKYDQVIKLVRNANQIRKQEKLTKIFQRQQKDIHKRMKKKMYHKKKSNRSELKDTKASKFSQTRKISLFDQAQKKQEQIQESKREKYSIQELNKVNTLQRSYSSVIDVNTVKMIRNKMKNKGKDSDTKDQENQQQQVLNRIKSSTNAQDTQEQSWKDTNTKKNDKRKRRMSFFAQDDFQVQDIKPQQLQYLSLALKEFDDLDEAVRKYKIQNGELPTCDLSGFQIPYDEDIKPATMAIDQWQAMTNILD